MDNKSPSKKATKEVARELLIAISNSLPDKTVESSWGSEIKKSDGVAVANGDEDDKFRSELISISYAESPDIKI
ncbi:hypothetical protein QN277_028034 [Acacia crassicarpa]|uniref:Uncharacterized protein n=1 Tax=Acacia crassicarpa TaxID=499986 RepID=A0AAE1MEQ9_9FABA|nr:hypothetical protein QN277_028034 [Acacia crassicarpa]